MEITFLIDIWILSSIFPYLVIVGISTILDRYVINYEPSAPVLIVYELSFDNTFTKTELMSYLLFIILCGSLFGGIIIIWFICELMKNIVRLYMIYKKDKLDRLKDTPFWRLKKYGGYLS